MSEIDIYGASDDLVEVEGTIREEFNALDTDDGMYLAVSDGTVLHVVYSAGGVWRINLVVKGTAGYRHTPAPENDEDNYSDRVTLSGNAVRWVVAGSHFASVASG